MVIATPEKALLDLFHLHGGEWDGPRMREMRFQHCDVVDPRRLLAGAHRMGKPRILRAVGVWRACCGAPDEGEDGVDL